MDVISINVGDFSNLMKLTIARFVIERAFKEFISSKMNELYLTVYKKCAQNPSCNINCFQTVHRKDNWCVSCICLKDEILKSCRHKGFSDKIYWKSFSYDTLMSSPEDLTKMFLPEWNKGASLDLSSMLTLFHNCKAFDMINMNIIRDVRIARNKYFAHNTNLGLNEFELKKCLNRFNALAHVIKHTPFGQKVYQELQDIENLNIVEFLKQTKDNNMLEQIEKDIPFQLAVKFQEQMPQDAKDIVRVVAKQVKQKRRNCSLLFPILLQFIASISIHMHRSFIKLRRNLATPTGIFVACLVLGWMFGHLPSDTRSHNRRCASMKYKYPWESEIFFEGYNQDHENFIGREWLYEDLEKIILSSTKGVIVTADMGYGKTAFFANLVCAADDRTSAGTIRNHILAFHMCKFDVLSTQKPVVFIRNIVGKIVTEIPEFGNIVLMDDTILRFLKPEKCSEDPYGCIDFGLIHPLNQLSTVPEKVLIFIEALDECDELLDSKTHNIIKILHHRITKFPRWLKFVFISRNISSLLTQNSILDRYHLDSQDKRNMADIKHFINTLGNKTTLINNEIEDKLTKSSNGSFLFLIHALLHWNSNNNSNIEDIPGTIEKIYQNNFERVFGIDGDEFENARTIFEILSSTYYPVTDENLVDIARTYSNTSDHLFLRLIRKDIGHFLTYRAGYIQISHKSVQDWLLQNNKDQTAFYISKKNGHRIFCTYLFQQFNENPHRPVSDVFTLAMHISESRNDNFKKLFVEHFKNLHENTRSTEPLIHLASRQLNHYEGMKLIIQITPEHIDIRNRENVTAVFLAAKYGHVNTLNALLDKGANAFFKVKNIPLLNSFNDVIFLAKNVFLWGYNPLHIAAQNNHSAVVKSLLKRDQSLLSDKNDLGLNAFQVAAERGHVDILKLFLSKNASLVDEHSLYYSSLNGHLPVVDLLLRSGGKDNCLPCNGSLYWVKPNYLRFQGKKTLTVIKRNFLYDYYFQNLSLSSTVLTDDERLLTCESSIHGAVRMGHKEVVKRLLMQSKNTLECTNVDGLTPLFYAIKFNRTNIFELLVENGANLSHVCDGNITISGTERIKLDQQELSLIMGSLCTKRLHVAHMLAIYNRVSIGLYLVKKQFSKWDSLDLDKSTALHYAACHSSLNMIALLYKVELKLDARSFNGSSPFHSAVSCHSVLGIMMLDEYFSGNPHDLNDNDGLDLFHYAFLNPVEESPQDEDAVSNHAHMIYFLYNTIFKTNYNFSRTDNYNKTALQYGIEKGYYRSVDLIYQYHGQKNVAQWKNIYSQTYLDLAFQSLPYFSKIDASIFRKEINNDLIYVLSPYDLCAIFLIRLFAEHNMHVLQKKMKDYVRIAADKSRYYVLMELRKINDLNFTDKAFVTVLLQGVSPVLIFTKCSDCIPKTEVISCGKNTTKYPLHEIVMNQNNTYWYYSPVHSSFLDQVLYNFTAEELDHCLDKEGYNLLHRSLMGGHFAAVKYFVRKGMDITIKAAGRDPLTLVLMYAPYSSSLSSLVLNNPISESYFIDYYNRSKLVLSTVIVNNSTETINFKETSLFIFQQLVNRSQFSSFCKSGVRDLSSVHIAAAKGFTDLISEMYKYYGKSILRCKTSDRFTPLYFAKIFNNSHTVDFMSIHVTLELPIKMKEAILFAKLLFSFKHPFPGNSTLLDCLYKTKPLPLLRAAKKLQNCVTFLNNEMNQILNKKNTKMFDNILHAIESKEMSAIETKLKRSCFFITKFCDIYKKSPLSLLSCSVWSVNCLNEICKQSCSFPATSFEYCWKAIMLLNSIAVRNRNLYLKIVRWSKRTIVEIIDELFLFKRSKLLLDFKFVPYLDTSFIKYDDCMSQKISLKSYFYSGYLDVLKPSKSEYDLMNTIMLTTSV